MAGRAFKGWGLLLNSFNRGFNPGSFVSGAERGTANAQRRDDIARAGAMRQQDKQDAAEAAKRADNDRMLGQVATSPEEWDAAIRYGWRPGGEVDDGVLKSVQDARLERAAAAASQARAAEAAKDAQDIRKRQAELDKAKVAAGPGHARVNLERRLALGGDLLRRAGGDIKVAEEMRRRDPRYRRAIFPSERGAGSVAMPERDVGTIGAVAAHLAHLKGLGLEAFTPSAPLVGRLLKHYENPSPKTVLAVGADVIDQIEAIGKENPELARSLHQMVQRMELSGSVRVVR